MNAVRYFGAAWDAPILDGATAVTTPVGQACYDCNKPVAAGDRGFLRPTVRKINGEWAGTIEPVHAECDLRTVMGHQVGVCPCTGYGHDRAAGRLVWQRVQQLKRGGAAG
jgi:hypothetical protein